MNDKPKLFYQSKEKGNGWSCEHKSGCYGCGAGSRQEIIEWLEKEAADGYFYVGEARFSFSVKDFTALNPSGKVVTLKTKFGNTANKRSKGNVKKEINQFSKSELRILSENLREGWHFKPGNVWKDFCRKPGDSEPKIWANINFEKVANRAYSKFGFEILECHILEDTGLPVKERHYGKGKYWTVYQAKKKIDELMAKIDNFCKNFFYSIWDNRINGVKWFRGDKEVSEKECFTRCGFLMKQKTRTKKQGTGA